MRYLLTGGGTGGHIYPALSIAAELKLLDPKAEFLYVGTADGRESSIVPPTGIPFRTISSAGLVNLSAIAKVTGVLKALYGTLESLRHIRRFKPDVVIGTGGFVCGPALLAARLAGRPVVIQEQNAFPGVANRIAGRWAKLIFVPYEEAKPHFSPGAVFQTVGNPIRAEVGAATRAEGRQVFGIPEDQKVLLVMGGSGGARDFNRAVTSAVRMLSDITNLMVIHITGERYLKQVQTAYGDKPGVKVTPYLHNMPQAYAAADAGVFRAGAITLAELQVRGLPSVLVPSPNVTHDHQTFNARILERRGAALLVLESDAAPEALAQALREVLLDQELRASMQKALLTLAEPDAGRKIANAIMEIAKGR